MISVYAVAASRRITGRTQTYQLKVQLRNVRPPIWRRLLVPGDITLAELHEVIQTAIGWTNTHLHEFEIDRVSYRDPDPDWESEFADESKVKLSRVAHPATNIRHASLVGGPARRRTSADQRDTKRSWRR